MDIQVKLFEDIEMCLKRISDFLPDRGYAEVRKYIQNYEIHLEQAKQFCKISNVDKWTIERIGNLGLCYKSFIGKDTTDKDLEICVFNNDGTRYTIASFNYDDKEHYYSLDSCGNRLKNDDIDWRIFGELVRKAYKRLEE